MLPLLLDDLASCLCFISLIIHSIHTYILVIREPRLGRVGDGLAMYANRACGGNMPVHAYIVYPPTANSALFHWL